MLTPPHPAYHELASAIDVPSLLVVGDRPVVTPDVAAELRGLNRRLRVVQIPDAGHGLPFEQPGRLSEVVLSFLRELADSSAPAVTTR